MKTIGTAAALLALAATAPPASAQALEHGSKLIGGGAFLAVDEALTGETRFQMSLGPRLEYFLSDGVTLGGQLGMSYARQGDNSSTGFHAGPAATWFFVRDNRLHPFVRLTGRYEVTRFKGDINDTTTGGWGIGGAVGLLFLLNQAVGIDAQLFVDRSAYENAFGDDVDRTIGGLRLGVAAFVH